MRDLFDKQLPKKLDRVYQWIDPGQLNASQGNFLYDVKSKETHAQVYHRELKMQQSVVKKSESKLFFNEIIQIWHIFFDLLNYKILNQKID